MLLSKQNSTLLVLLIEPTTEGLSQGAIVNRSNEAPEGGQVALHYSADLTVRYFGIQNNALHVQHSAFHLPTCKVPERILSKNVIAASLQILSLAEANAGTGIGTSIFSSIWWFSYLLQPQLWEATKAPHYFWPCFATRPHLQVL